MAEDLLPPEIACLIPHPRRAPGYGPSAVAYVKFVAPWQGRRWYVTLFDPEDGWCWTKYVGPEGPALMGVHVATLQGLRGPNGECVRRDPSFTQLPLAQCEPDAVPTIVRGEERL